MNNLIIGIAGGSGSGKTTLAIRLKERFGEDEVRLISHDSYYKRHDELPFAERCKLNYDHPDAFDNDLLIEHLRELKAGRAIDCPVYDYADHNRSSEVQHIEPAPVLIVEGILPLAEPELCKLFDYKIYVAPTPMSASSAASCGTSRSAAARWTASSPSTAPRSSPCTKPLWSPASATPTSSSPTAARTAPPSRCWPTTSAASSRKPTCSNIFRYHTAAPPRCFLNAAGRLLL